MFLGNPSRASRDKAVPVVSATELATWASEQAEFISLEQTTHEDQVGIADQIRGMGGNVGNLKICEIGDKYYSLGELGEFLKSVDEIWVVFNASISLKSRKLENPKRSKEFISVDVGATSFFGHFYLEKFEFMSIYDRSLEGLVIELIKNDFNISKTVIDEYRTIEDGCSVYEGRAPAFVGSNSDVTVRGKYYCRNMTQEKILEFFIPESEREK